MPRLHPTLVGVACAWAVAGLGSCAGDDAVGPDGPLAPDSDVNADGVASDAADNHPAGDLAGPAGSGGAPIGAGWSPTVLNTEQLVPADNLPAAIATRPSNNNLDVALHDGRLFLAWRTAPDHFASPKTELHVVSSDDDGATWRFEATFARGTDLREPRFVSVGGELRLYFAVLGKSPVDFEPQGTLVSTYRGAADWSDADWVLEPGFIPWRTRTLDGLVWLIGYAGGEAVYDEGGSIAIHWLTSGDGLTWTAAVEDQPVVLTGGGSEADFAFLEDGAVVAVVRNEAGDHDGYGSKICRAEADALGDWSCATDPRKYDSPLLFTHAGDVWLVGRRHVTDTGWYDLGLEIPDEDKYLEYQLAYCQEPKRCAMWRVDPIALEVTHVLDLPSGGDTCFPSVIQTGDHAFDLYNYSSPVDSPETADISWIDGQLGETRIYRHAIAFEPPTR